MSSRMAQGVKRAQGTMSAQGARSAQGAMGAQGARSAQGTMEYLIIVAVVVVLGLIAIGVATNFLSGNAGTEKSGIKLAWLSKEISILDAVGDTNGNTTFVLRSNIGSNISVDSIGVNGVTYVVSGGSIKMHVGDVHPAQVLAVTPPCIGEERLYKVKINYTSSNSLSKSVPEGDYYVPCVGGTAGSIASAITFSDTPIKGTIPVSNGDGNYHSSGTAITGLLVLNNALCFGGTHCDANIGVAGGNLVFYG